MPHPQYTFVASDGETYSGGRYGIPFYSTSCDGITEEMFKQPTTVQGTIFYDPNNPDHLLMTNTVLPTILSSLKIIGSVSCAQVKLSDDNLAWNDDRTSLRINLTRQNENGDHWQIIIESIGETAKIELAQRFDTAITRSLAKALGYNLVQCQTRKFAALLEHPTDLKPAV